MTLKVQWSNENKTVYLAARYGRRKEMLSYVPPLNELGYGVISRWVYGGNDIIDTDTNIDKEQYAKEDLEDIDSARIVISFTDPLGTVVSSRGGRHVELGYALGWNNQALKNDELKRLILIGPRENVFHWLPDIEHYHTWKDFLEKFTIEQLKLDPRVYTYIRKNILERRSLAVDTSDKEPNGSRDQLYYDGKANAYIDVLNFLKKFAPENS